MEIESELADIFTKELNMTLPEMIVLESIMLDAIDAALVAHEPALALEAEDVLLDLHALKRSRVRRAGDGVLAFWERQLIPDPRLTFAGGGRRPGPRLPNSRRLDSREPKAQHQAP